MKRYLCETWDMIKSTVRATSQILILGIVVVSMVSLFILGLAGVIYGISEILK